MFRKLSKGMFPLILWIAVLAIPTYSGPAAAVDTISFSGWVKTVPNWPSTDGMAGANGAVVNALSEAGPPPVATAAASADGTFTLLGLTASSTFRLVIPPVTGYVPVLSKFMNWNANIQALLPFTIFTQTQYGNFGNTANTGMIMGRVALKDSPTTFLSGATITATEWFNGAPTGTTYPVTYTSGSSTQADGIYMVKNVPNGKVVQLVATLAGHTFEFNGSVVPVQADSVSEDSFFAIPAGSCSYFLTPAIATWPAEGGASTVQVTAGAGCNWTAVSSNTDWLHVTAGASGSGNGTVSYTVSANPGAGRPGVIMIGGQPFAVAQGGPAVSGPIVGTWGAAALQYENTPQAWYAEATRATFNANGTGTLEGVKNDGVNVPGQRIKQFLEAFTYSASANADASINLSMNIGGDVKQQRVIISDNGNMAVMDGTSSSNREKLAVLLKIDTAKTYANADVNGDYYFLGFESNVAGVVDPPNGNGKYMAISGIQSFNAATGKYSYYGKANSVKIDNSNYTWDDPGKTNQDYTVNPTGDMTVGGGAFHGAIAGNGRIAGGSGSYISDNWLAYFFMKKGDRTYATSDIAGKWAVVSFGQDNRTTPTPYMGFDSQIGTMTCSSGGACSYTFRDRRSGDGSTNVNSGSVTISVNADGSFGASVGDQAPAYAGAIGNDGNTILFNTSFNSTETWHREIFVGVRANSIGDLASGTMGSTVTVSGKVTDWNGAVIPSGVAVSLVGDASKTTTSNTSDGTFSLAGVPANTTVSLKFSKTGYLDVYLVDFSPSADMNISTDAYGGVGQVTMPTVADLTAFGAMPASGKSLITGRARDNTYRYSSTVGSVAITATGASKTYPVFYRDPFGNLCGPSGNAYSFPVCTSTWGNGRYYVLNVDGSDTVTLTAAKSGWAFPSRIFHTHGDAMNQGQIWGTAPGYNASISGVVRNFDGSATISGATIALNGDPGKSTASGGDGSFTFNGLAQDTNFYAKVTANGFVPTYAGPLNFGSTPVAGVSFLLATPAEMAGWGVASGNGVIGGLVTDQSLNTISGATVTLTSKSGTAYTVNYVGGSGSTSATGKFLIPNVVAGDVVKIEVTKAGYTFTSYYLDAFADAATTKYIMGTATGGSTVTASGYVKDWTGAVIPSGVTVSLVGDASKTTTSNTTDGSFSLVGVPANTTVSLKFSKVGYLDVYLPDIGPQTSDFNISNDSYGGSVHVSMPTVAELEAFGAKPTGGKALIWGRIADNTYRASSHVGGVVVTATGSSKTYPVFHRDPFGNLCGPSGNAYSFPVCTSTWGNGRYYVLNVDDADAVTVTAAKTGWSFMPRTFHTHGDAVSQGRVWGTAPGYNASLSGVVKTFDGTATISGATIALNGDPGKSTTSGAGGAFTFGGLPQDVNFYAKVTANGFVPTYAGPVSFGSTPVTGVTLSLGTPAEMAGLGVASGNGLIGGLVADQSLNAISGATVTLTSKSGTAYTVNYAGGTGSTSASGRFLVPNVVAGDVVKIEVTKAGYTFASYYLDAFADAATTKYFVGTATTTFNTISGTVSYSGIQTGNIRLKIWPADGTTNYETEISVAALGAFSFTNVPNGQYYIAAYRDSNNSGSYTAGEAYGYYQDAAGPMKITLVGAGASNCNITMADPAGTPTGVAVSINSALTGLNGMFIFFRQGENVQNAINNSMEPVFSQTVNIIANTNVYTMTTHNRIEGMPLPAGTYDFYFMTGDFLHGPVKGVIQYSQSGVVINRGAVTAIPSSGSIAFNTGGTVSGTVTSSQSNNALYNAGVYLAIVPDPINQPGVFTVVAWAKTDVNGNFQLDHVPIGSYYLNLVYTGYGAFTPIAVNVTSNGQFVAVPFDSTKLTPQFAPGSISGTLTPFGSTVQSRVILKSGTTTVAKVTPSATNGSYTIADVLPGTYDLIGSARGYAPKQVSVTITTGQSLTQNITLESPKNAVVNALNWLLAHQRADGSLDDNPTGDAHQYVFGWTGYAGLSLLAIYENPKYSNAASPDYIGDTLKNQIHDALYGVAPAKNGIKQYFESTYRAADDPNTSWSDVGAFYNDSVKWMPVASTPVALEKLIALGMPLNDPKVLASVQFLLNAQITAAKASQPIFAGGWRYNPTNTDTDNWETPWVIMALMKAGVNPSVQAVIDGLSHIKRSQITTGDGAGLFHYQPNDTSGYGPMGTSAACVLALNFAGEANTQENVARFFQWVKNNPEFGGFDRYADAYWWSMFPWAAILYDDPATSNPVKKYYDTLDLTWNMADDILRNQNADGSWSNPSYVGGGSNSGNSVMFTASALMAVAPYAGLTPRPNEAIVSGTVSGLAGNIEGAKVEALLDGVVRASALTGTGGAYTLNVPQNYSYEIRVTTAGYVRRSINTASVGPAGLTGQNIAYAAADVDTAAPTITGMTPANSSTVDVGKPVISAVLADVGTGANPPAGIDPATIAMKVDGNTASFSYNAANGIVSYNHPVNDMPNGIHNATVDVKDYAGNSAVQAAWTFTVAKVLPGDINGDGKVDLADAVLALKVMAGLGQTGVRANYAASGADINGDGKVGLQEIEFILQTVLGLR